MLVHDFNPDWTLAVSATCATSAVIGGILSIKASLYAKTKHADFRRSAGLLVFTLACLVFAACWKKFLYERLAGGFDRSFSSDFELAPSNFFEAIHKPFGSLVYVPLLGIICAYLFFVMGVWRFLRILFPLLNRFHSALILGQKRS